MHMYTLAYTASNMDDEFSDTSSTSTSLIDEVIIIFYEIHKCNLIYFIQYVSTGNKLSGEDKEVHSLVLTLTTMTTTMVMMAKTNMIPVKVE